MRPKNKKEGRHQRAGVCLLLTGVMVVGMMALIFAFSAQDASRSSDLSGGLCGRIVRGVLTLLGAGADQEKTELWVGILETPVRKLAHFTEYALFSVIVCTHGLMHRLVSGKRPALFQTGREAFRGFLPLFARTVPFCILYAVSDEVHQYFVPGRSCRLFDVGVDSTGILFGAALFLLTVQTQKVKIWIKWLQGPDKIKAQYDTSCREAAERYPVPDRSERIITMRCIELLEGLTYECLQGDVQVSVSAVINDSRKIAEGCMFLCIRGAAFDGHSFAGEAAKAGAAVLVVEEPVDVPEHVTVIKVDNTRYAMALISAAWFGHPDQEITTIAVTGTKGKTTTTYMIKDLLEKCGHRTGVIGTIEVVIGEKHIPVNNTTPESYDIHRYFREMVEDGCDCVVMEASSQGFKLDRTAGIVFDYGLFTNLSPDHIGPNEHKDFAEYLSCKAKLFTQCKKGFANLDDEHFAEVTAQAVCPVQTFGLNEKADLRASDIALTRGTDFLGVDFTVSGLLEGRISCGVPGAFNVHNALGAICIALEMGADLAVINEALRSFTVKGRVQIIPTGYEYTLIVDYAHNAVALESILKTLREYQPARLISLFGCGGNRSKLRRFEMGEVSGRLADLTIITSDNPRFEEPQAIMDDILTGIRKTDGQYIAIIDRREAISYAMHHAQPGDIVVLAGKGHENYQEIKGRKYHMSEEEIVQDVLDGKY